MVASTSVPLSKQSQKSFIEYYRNVQNVRNTTRQNSRCRFERVDREYQREVDLEQENLDAKRANKTGDSSRFQNMTVPVIMPQVEAAVTHQTSVFLTGTPLFGVVADPQFIDEALMLETTLEDNSIRGSWARELMLFFRDGFKYNRAPVEVSWEQEVTYSVVTDLEKNLTEGIPKEVIWSGNRIKRLDPYNTFYDETVPPSEVYKKGEYAGYTDLISRIELKSFIARLPDVIVSSVVPALESGLGGAVGATDSTARNFFIPTINPEISEEDFKRTGTNWLKWAGLSTALRESKINYKDMYEITTLYAKVLPSEFSLHIPNRETPQIFKLIIINHEHIIYAEQQTNAHAYIPILIGQPLEDGLDYQTKSLAENGSDFQALASAYMNSIIASRRRAISDRVLYDPSRITSAAINSANPSAKIPVRPAAYGKNISDAVHHFDYREDQAASSMQQIQTILSLANNLSGQNLAQQGQFVKGNRTLSEFESVMQNAAGRDQLASILIEHQVFVPMKQILKLNTLQFQGGTTVYNRDKKLAVEIDPVKLRKAVLEFKISDGLVPSSKAINAESFTVALQTMQVAPNIGNGYNITQVFSYLMKTQGADLTDFEKSAEQLAYEQALSQWQGLAQLAIEKDLDPNTVLPPMPLPEQFNYDPRQNKPAPEGAGASRADTPANSLPGAPNTATPEPR